MDIRSLAAVTDAELLARTSRLAQGEFRATAALVAHLAEIDTRELYLGEACSSLFIYCIRVLKLSEPAAYNRIYAARASRRFPAVLASLERGRVHLAAVRLLAPVLTEENHRELLAAATHKTKREVEELLARVHPQPDVPSRVRKLPAPRPDLSWCGAGEADSKAARPERPVEMHAKQQRLREPEAQLEEHAGFHCEWPTPTHAPAQAESIDCPRLDLTPTPARPRAVVVPLAPERYKVQFTAGASTREKLRRAQELLRHRIPDGDLAEVIDLALDLLVRDLEKQKFSATGRTRVQHVAPRSTSQSLPQPTPQVEAQAPAQAAPRLERASPALTSRYIPASVRRAVWERDEGQCAFVSGAGERCLERAGLEFDHIRPHADGGSVELQNLRLLCREHNQYEARQFFGVWEVGRTRPPVARHR